MNKIISMSAFGTDTKYFVGAQRQAELAQKNYPDWQIRIYTNNLSLLNNINDNVEVIEVNESSWGPFWRFDPLFEDDNNITIVRDSDDRITLREVMAVEEWLNSDAVLHIIKDHEAHFQFPIMAGLFGFKGRLHESLYKIMQDFKFKHQYYLSDQIFLRDYVYPRYSSSCLSHTFISGWFSQSRNNLINKYCFCGNGYDENDNPIYPESLDSKIDYSKNIVFDGGKLTE